MIGRLLSATAPLPPAPAVLRSTARTLGRAVHDSARDELDGSVRREVAGLAVTVSGLAAAGAGRVLRRTPLAPWTPLAAAAVTFVDNQPRVRRKVERVLGPEGTNLALTVAAAVAHGLNGGVAPLGVDAAGRAQSLAAARARRDGLRSVRTAAAGAPPERPAPVPAGPVERLADRTAVGALVGAGLAGAFGGGPRVAAQLVLATAPKAAFAARNSFADALTIGLASQGVVVGNRAALRLLDRVDTLLVDADVLTGANPTVLSAAAVAEGWTTARVWRAAQQLLAGRSAAAGVALVGGPTPGRGVSSALLTEHGETVGTLVLGYEPDEQAVPLLAAARSAGLQVVLSAEPSTAQLAAHADRTVALGDDPSASLQQEIRRLQAAGAVVAAVTREPDVVAAADVGVALLSGGAPVPLAAAAACRCLSEVTRVVGALGAARRVSRRGVTLATGASSLGVLLLAVNARRPGGASLPANVAAASALIAGRRAALRCLAAAEPAPVPQTPWHALEAAEVLRRIERFDALVHPVPVERRWGDGLTGAAGDLIRNVRAELADPLTPVLATGAAASAVIGSTADAVLVAGVLAGNAVVSGAQRLRAERALRALLRQERPVARLIRCPHSPREEARTVAADRLLPGDVIELGTGDVVPADARLLAGDDLEVDESSLTGESGGVTKQVAATPGVELGERACMLYEGTSVLAGSGEAVVVAVGTATEAGRAVQLAGAGRSAAGMQSRLEELTRRGLPITLLGGAAVTALARLRRQPLRRAIASGVGVAVAAVPEGLPLVATVAQSTAARRLTKRGVLVRSARSLEALGRVDTVCFDKTGTLTEGRLRLVRVAGVGADQDWAPDDPRGAELLRAAARACPDGRSTRGTPHVTDQAVADGARAVLGDRITADWNGLQEIPFQSDRGYSAELGRSSGTLRLVAKGAPEVMLGRCTTFLGDGGPQPLTSARRAAAEQRVAVLAGQGLRVLAVARRNLDGPPADGDDLEGCVEQLTLLGFVALADVPRPEAPGTVAALRGAGLRPVMITGDHPVTAQAIARSLGIPTERVVTGQELAGVGEEEAARLVGSAQVFARVSPEQKLRIIAGLQRSGRVVAMTGDGANDAAAIRLADIGIGMSAVGSTSARSAADLVLTVPDLRLLTEALIEGRALWRRVHDAVGILLGGNAGEVAFTLVGTALAGRAPLGPRQFLLVNMLTDLLPAMAIAIAGTPEDAGARRDILLGGVPSLAGPLRRNIELRGAATALGALLAWQVGRCTGTRTRADTMALAALVGTQLGQTLLVGGRTPLVAATSVGSTLALVTLIQVPPVSVFFGCRPLGPVAWATVLGSAAAATGASVLAPRLLHSLHVRLGSPGTGRTPDRFSSTLADQSPVNDPTP